MVKSRIAGIVDEDISYPDGASDVEWIDQRAAPECHAEITTAIKMTCPAAALVGIAASRGVPSRFIGLLTLSLGLIFKHPPFSRTWGSSSSTWRHRGRGNRDRRGSGILPWPGHRNLDPHDFPRPCAQQDARSASPMASWRSWVMKRIVTLVRLQISSSWSCNMTRVWASKGPNGSSINMTLGE